MYKTVLGWPQPIVFISIFWHGGTTRVLPHLKKMNRNLIKFSTIFMQLLWVFDERNIVERAKRREVQCAGDVER